MVGPPVALPFAWGNFSRKPPVCRGGARAGVNRCAFPSATKSCANFHSSASAPSRGRSAMTGWKSRPSRLVRTRTCCRRRGALGLRAAAAAEGIVISSLHYLMLVPQGLSITSEASAEHERSIDVMRRLCDLAADLGARVLVHGSPAQRQLRVGGEAEGRKRAVAAFAAAARRRATPASLTASNPSPPRKPNSSIRSRKPQPSSGRSRTRPCAP